MCGIFGYIGNKENAADVVLDGLKLLEYRGYDSWGIAVKEGRKIVVEKHVGKIGDAKVSLPKSTIGIGHTRWATHGGVTEKNAHPHLDCTGKIAVLHNGIIENFQDLKAELAKQNHIFVSETDTEVAAHMIEDALKQMPFAESVRTVFQKLTGLNAFLVLHADTEEIVAIKSGSPLVIGKGDQEIFVASDVSGLISHTREILFLRDNEMAVLNRDIRLISVASGKPIPAEFETVDWKIESADKGKYPHFMLKEIHEQGKIIRNIAENYEEQITSLAKKIIEAKGTFFIGAGTASYACLSGTYYFSKIAKVHVNMAFASEFNYLEDFLHKGSLVIALSQSGETIDVVEPLEHAKEKGSSIIALVNALGSTIYRMADDKLLLGAGPEKAVASTKVYSAMLSLLLYLSYAMVGEQKEAKKLLLAAADEADRLLSQKTLGVLDEVVSYLEHKEHIYVIGRGVSYASALEGALKIKEVSYIHTEGVAGGELKHGPIALVAKGTPCIVFAPNDETHGAIISNAMEIKARGGYMIGIGPKSDPVFDRWIEVKDVGEASSIPQVIPMQIIAYLLAVIKGFDPDKPRNLAKSVTVK